MKTFRIGLYCMVALFLLAGCAARQKGYVVLMENADGTTGTITVSNAKSEQLIDKKGYGVDLYDENEPLKSPSPVSDEKIKTDFAKTFIADPDAPVSYLLYFELGQTILTKESQQKIEEIISTIKKRTVPTIGIIGHTDRAGEIARNYALGLSRAEFVRDVLLKAGISRESVAEVSSHGESNPLIKTAAGMQEPLNRRVEVVVW